MRFFAVFALCLFAGAAFGSLIGASKEDIASFAQFMRKYNKKYESNSEFQNRFQIFRANMKKLEQLRGTSSAVYNVTKFADMTAEEFRKMPCGVDKLKDLNSRRPNYQAPVATAEDWASLQANAQAPPPVNFDWLAKGAVTPVKNQEQCGSCWAFSTIGNVEGVWFLAGNPLIGLSEQELVDCTTESQGCDGGWPFWALTDVLASPYSGHIDTEASYPYTAEDGSCAFSSGKVGATVSAFKSWCTEETADCTEDNMVQLLLQYGPLSACLDALPMQYYQSGIDNPSDCDPDSIDHCITITGYGVDNGVKYWKIKNSWGTDWGEQGYYRLIRGIGACGINKVITIATAKK